MLALIADLVNTFKKLAMPRFLFPIDDVKVVYTACIREGRTGLEIHQSSLEWFHYTPRYDRNTAAASYTRYSTWNQVHFAPLLQIIPNMSLSLVDISWRSRYQSRC